MRGGGLVTTCKRCNKTTPLGVVFCSDCLKLDTVRFWCSKCGSNAHMQLRYAREFFVEYGIRPIPTTGAIYEFLDGCPVCAQEKGIGSLFAYQRHMVPEHDSGPPAVTPS